LAPQLFHPDDPTHITEEIKRTEQYTQALDSIQEGLRGLLAALKKSVPFFSLRYQGHMNWELTIAALFGYFSSKMKTRPEP
jgi:hypothetical protein